MSPNMLLTSFLPPDLPLWLELLSFITRCLLLLFWEEVDYSVFRLSFIGSFRDGELRGISYDYNFRKSLGLTFLMEPLFSTNSGYLSNLRVGVFSVFSMNSSWSWLRLLSTFIYYLRSAILSFILGLLVGLFFFLESSLLSLSPLDV